MNDTVTEQTATVTLTFKIKVLNRTITRSNALSYVRQHLREYADETLGDCLRDVASEVEQIPQDEIDNALYPPCLRCDQLFPCECSDDEVSAFTQAGSGSQKPADGPQRPSQRSDGS